MEPIGWVVVTNGKKFRLRDMTTGRWYTETRHEPLFGGSYEAIKEWNSEENARAVAEGDTWRPVDGTT